MKLRLSERPALPGALRAVLYLFNPDTFLNHLPTDEQIRANSIELDPSRNIGRESNSLILAPNPRTAIRVGKKGSDNK